MNLLELAAAVWSRGGELRAAGGRIRYRGPELAPDDPIRAAIVGPLRVCGEATKAGRPCRVPIREDLGYTRCWSHGEGAGRTSTPRRMRRAS